MIRYTDKQLNEMAKEAECYQSPSMYFGLAQQNRIIIELLQRIIDQRKTE